MENSYYAEASKFFKDAGAVEMDVVRKNIMIDEAQDRAAKAGLKI